MVITIGSDTLCDGATRDVDKNAGPGDGWSRGSGIGSQVAEFLRSDNIKVFDRKNRRCDFKFSVVRLCQSLDAANEYALLHGETVTRNGTVTIQLVSKSLRILNAELVDIQCTCTGRSVHVAYSIVGGKVEVVPA